jgi:hypothetical protein
VLETPNKIASAISLPINMKVFKNETSVGILNCEPSYMKCTVPYFDIPDDYEYSEADELEYIKQSFELRYPDEDDVTEDWGFIGRMVIDCTYDDNYPGKVRTTKFRVDGMGTLDIIYDRNEDRRIDFYKADGSWLQDIQVKASYERIQDTLTIPEGSVYAAIRLYDKWETMTINGQVISKGDLIYTGATAADIRKEPYMSGCLKNLIDWVDNCADEEFVNDFEEHFHKDYTLRYFCLVTLLGAVDNLG